MEHFKLTLPQEWVARIMQIISKQPYEQVADMMDGIKHQVALQMQQARQGQQNGTGDTAAPPATPSTVQ